MYIPQLIIPIHIHSVSDIMNLTIATILYYDYNTRKLLLNLEKIRQKISPWNKIVKLAYCELCVLWEKRTAQSEETPTSSEAR